MCVCVCWEWGVGGSVAEQRATMRPHQVPFSRPAAACTAARSAPHLRTYRQVDLCPDIQLPIATMHLQLFAVRTPRMATGAAKRTAAPCGDILLSPLPQSGWILTLAFLFENSFDLSI